jgi:hypothetical protein
VLLAVLVPLAAPVARTTAAAALLTLALLSLA